MTLVALGVVIAVAGVVAAVTWLVRTNATSPVTDDGDATRRRVTADQTGHDHGPTEAEDRDSSPEESELSDPDLICALLDQNGGRMQQAEIVESVDWSKAKVSRLLTTLEANDRIVKTRLGRENLISLPGHEPRLARSPYEAPDDDQEPQ